MDCGWGLDKVGTRQEVFDMIGRQQQRQVDKGSCFPAWIAQLFYPGLHTKIAQNNSGTVWLFPTLHTPNNKYKNQNKRILVVSSGG